MTTPRVDVLVEDYLARLHVAARSLPPDRAAELVEGISEHLSAARAAGAAADEAAVRTLLDRLGEPEEIVAAAREDAPPGAFPYPPPYPAPYPMAPPMVAVRPSAVMEGTALALMTLGSFIPLIGWLVGVVLLWGSARLRTWEKLLATLVVPGGPGIVLLLAFAAPIRTCTTSISRSMIMPMVTPGGATGDVTPSTVVEHCTGTTVPPALGIALLVVSLVGPFVVAGLLWARVRARVALEPPIMRPAATGNLWGGLEISAVVLLGLGTFVVPILGPLVGLALAWSSTRWTSKEKAIATVLSLGPALVLLLGLGAAYFLPSAVLVGSALVLVFFGAVGPCLAAVYLLVVLNGRR
jgi:hypothetical protein